MEIVYLYLRDFGFCVPKAESINRNDLESQAMCLTVIPFPHWKQFPQELGVDEAERSEWESRICAARERGPMPPTLFASCAGQTEGPGSSGGSKNRRAIDFWTLWEKARVGCFKRTALKHVYYLGWNRSPAQGGCMRQVPGPGALGRPRGIGWRGRWERGLGLGIHVYPWLIHVNVWRKPLQYCKVISFQLIIKKKNGRQWPPAEKMRCMVTSASQPGPARTQLLGLSVTQKQQREGHTLRSHLEGSERVRREWANGLGATLWQLPAYTDDWASLEHGNSNLFVSMWAQL